jgi:DNA polymerase
MRTLAIDIETYSSVDLKEAGVYVYANAPDFEILLIAYKLDDQEVQLIDIAGEHLSPFEIDILFPDFMEALTDSNIIKTAYNANFERTCLAKYFDMYMYPQDWRCTAVHASTLGLPQTLAGVGEALGLAEDKKKLTTGKSLITYFCGQCKPTKKNGERTRNLPEHDRDKWTLFGEYCKQDVVAETEIKKMIEKYEITKAEQDLWNLDQKINDNGIRIDIGFVETIIEYDEQYQAKIEKEARQITKLENPNSVAQLKKWFADKGLEVDSLAKDTVSKMIFDCTDKDVKRVLELRREMSKTSTKKYEAMQRSVCPDGKIRGILQFYGANRTGRWAGRIVQVHNLPQNKIPDIELARELVADKDFETLEMLFQGTPFVLSQLVRTAFIASPDSRFIISDFSAIEARVIAWLAGEQWRLDVFNTHGKIYEASASQMFKVPIEQIKKGSPLRQKGKVAELALGYQGSVGALIAMGALDMGLKEDELPLLVSSWREANNKIVRFWYIAENAAKAAIKERRTVKIQQGIEFSYVDKILFIKLPSERKLAYYDTKLELQKGKEVITYAGVNQDTKVWGRLQTYGGKIVENIVQATARDCLAVAMTRIDKAGYTIAMHIHDEIVIDVPNSINASEEITKIMGTGIDWAKGLPLKGDTYETPFYKKD